MKIQTLKVKPYCTKMKSDVVKLNSTGKYFQVEFTQYNSIQSVKMVDNKKEATIFQEEGNILKGEKGGKIKIGQTRCTEFSFFLHAQGIKTQDITVETFDAPEQPLFSKQQRIKINEDIKTLVKLFPDLNNPN